eukprot:120983-Amphidinium_carterae.1
MWARLRQVKQNPKCEPQRFCWGVCCIYGCTRTWLSVHSTACASQLPEPTSIIWLLLGPVSVDHSDAALLRGSHVDELGNALLISLANTNKKGSTVVNLDI